MKITKLYKDPAEGSLGLVKNQEISIDTPVQVNGRVAYRETYYLRFSFDQYANNIRIKPSQSQVAARFNPYYLHLSDHNETFQTQNWQVEESNQLIKVHLTHPWRLTKVKTFQSHGIDILRLDGGALSEEPTVKANANYTIAAEFIGQDFALRKKDPYANSELTPASNVNKEGIGKQKAKHNQGALGNSFDAHLDGEVIKSNTAMEIDGGIGFGIEAQPIHGIDWIQLKSVPTGPRITIGEINQPVSEETAFTHLWNQPGEHTDTPVWLNSESGEAILNQLGSAIERYIQQQQDEGEAIASLIYVPITLESDTPAKFKWTNFSIEYSLLKRQWDHWTEEQKTAGKETINFKGDRLQSRSVQLNFPPATHLDKATLLFGTELKASTEFSGEALSLDLAQAQGMSINQGGSVAKWIDLSEPKQVNKIALALMPLTESARLNVELVYNQQGKPKGAVLAGSNLDISAQYRRHWHYAMLNQTVLLDAQGYWLRVHCVDGQVVWLADKQPGKAYSVTGIQDHLIAELSLLARLGLSLPVSDAGFPKGLMIKVDNELAVIDSEQVDLTDVLNDHISGNLELVSGDQGSITLYSPEIEYSWTG